MIIEEALNRRSETHGLPVMPHAFVTLIRIKKPSETVSGGRTIGFSGSALLNLYWSECGLHFALAQQSVSLKRAVPFSQVGQRGIHTAIAQSCRGWTLIGFLPSSALHA